MVEISWGEPPDTADCGQPEAFCHVGNATSWSWVCISLFACSGVQYCIAWLMQ